MTVNEFISADNEKIEKILNDYPKQIPCPVVAELLGCKPDGVRQAIAEGAFGIHWRLQGKLTSGNYEPSRGRWATISQQNCNLSSNHLITYCGETKPIAVWSRELGFNHKTLEKRIKKWGVERAFTTPIQVEFQRKRKSS